MIPTLSTIAIEEKNKLNIDSIMMLCLEIFVPGLEDEIRLSSYSSDLSTYTLDWRGDTWVEYEFHLSEISEGKGEVPRIDLSVANAENILDTYLDAYDQYVKANGFSPISVDIFLLNSKAIAKKNVTSIVMNGGGTLATVTCPAVHKLVSGKKVWIEGANEAPFNGEHVITYIDAYKFSYPLSYTPDYVATGTIKAQMITPEASYSFELKKHALNGETVTFTLSAGNPYSRRFPQHRIQKNNCRYRFKSPRCGYTGGITTCAHTLAACRSIQNPTGIPHFPLRFGNAPGVGQGGFETQ